MNVSSMIGMGAGFAAVGGIYALLSFRKPDLPIFKKYTKEQFYRNQGMMLAFCSFGIMLILLGLMTM